MESIVVAEVYKLLTFWISLISFLFLFALQQIIGGIKSWVFKPGYLYGSETQTRG
ncbi:hypothetical protein EI77_04197 [Prosthecobacter fusiformis]|uniref:Uncharacterized protein n=1 Tax=Prosthecobacter fusiformis TaxID=48464 RepID=A0A4R7RJU6_9BACT|nr:hypothetical protein EI77_04197 [Prosthecobacter fusiformis]